MMPQISRRTAPALAVVLVCIGLVVFALTLNHSSWKQNWPRAAEWTLATAHDQAQVDPFSATSLRMHETETAAIPLVRAVADFNVQDQGTSAVNVSVCAVPTHEEQYLPEWITYHRLQGVQRFYLFDNAPSKEMRSLLRPWLQEGTVVLYEMQYSPDAELAYVWQDHLLRLCQRHVMPRTRWVSHFDVDEFLMVDPSHWLTTVPVPVSKPEREEASAVSWSYPLHRLLAELDEALCIPMTRLDFVNFGARDLGRDEMVIERHTIRNKVSPSRSTYGKMLLHSKEQSDTAEFAGPHSCWPGRGVDKNVIMDATGFNHADAEWPPSGLPLTSDGIALHHYSQRSLKNCLDKFRVVNSTQGSNDWRVRDGEAGCARNYVPSEDEQRRAEEVRTEPFGDELVKLPWSLALLRDTRARDSFAGRATRAILNEWRRRSDSAETWPWEDGTQDADLTGIITVEI